MLRLAAVLAVMLASAANAAPIADGLTVKDFFAKLEAAAKELAEGGMEPNRIHCTDDGTRCEAFYGAANLVVAEAPSSTAGMETVDGHAVTRRRERGLLANVGARGRAARSDYLTVPERSQLILAAMRNPQPTAFEGSVARYSFDRSAGGLPRMIAGAR